MIEPAEITGGAGPFEAAVIAVVLDQIAREETAARRGTEGSTALPPWVRAMRPDESEHPLDAPDIRHPTP